MPAPFLRGQSLDISSSGSSITIPLPARNVDDFIFVTMEGNEWTNSVTKLPSLPPGYTFLDGYFTSNSFRFQAYKRITTIDEPDFVLTGPTTMFWWGNLDVFGGCDYTDPGYLDIAGGAGNYATYTRAAVSTPTEFRMRARVSLNALGVDNRILSWANNDAALGLDSSNRPYMWLTNTAGNRIGNLTAATPIPNLGSGRKVWVLGLIDVATAACRFFYAYTDIDFYQYPRYVEIGTTATGSNAGTTPRLTNSTTLYIGTNPSGTPTGMNVYVAVDGGPTPYSNLRFSEPLAAGVTLLGTTAHRRPSSGNSSPFEGVLAINPIPAGATSGTISISILGGNQRLVFSKWEGYADPNPVPAINPAIAASAGWTKQPDRQAPLHGAAVKEVLFTQVHDLGDTSFTGYPLDGGKYNGWQVAIFVLRPPVEPVLPPRSPQPPHIRLGCALDYTAWFTDGSYQNRIDSARWSSLTWERTLDAISTASAVFPDEYGGVRCLARLGGLEPWRYGLLIERDGVEVWRGPVVTVKRVRGAVQVAAADVFARYQKRFAVRDDIVSYENVDAAVLFRQIITTHAASTLDQWTLPVPAFDVDVNVTRELKPREFKLAWDFLSELMSSSIDAYIAAGVLYVWQPGVGWRYRSNVDHTLEGPYNSTYDFVYGTFTEESFRVQPLWALDGAGQGNFVVVPGTDTGELGFRSYEGAEEEDSQKRYGVLDLTDPDPMEVPADAPANLVAANLAARAASLIALRATPPFTIEGGVLSDVAPISVEHLRPGSLWKLDVFDEGFPQLLTAGRLVRVSVSVSQSTSGISEDVSPTLEPPGWMR